MKRRVAGALVFLALAAVSLAAQDVTGNWQGTLAAGAGLRLVFKISKSDTGAWQATLFSLDQQAPPLAASAVTVSGSTVNITIASIGGGFTGSLTGDGNRLTGTFSQAGHSIPLTLTRATANDTWPLPTFEALKPMAPAVSPGIEVADIKPSNPMTTGKVITLAGTNLRAVNVTAMDLISFGFGVQSKQVVDGPGWLNSAHFDITAKPDQPGVPDLNQLKQMVQALLTTRFHLVYHHETRTQSVYAIVVDKSGAKLTPSQADPQQPPALTFPKLGMLPARNATMADFAGVLQMVVLDRPVVDQTGLKGHYDFTLNWTPDETQFASMGGTRGPGAGAPPSDDANAPPDLFTAIREQLGLRLEATKAPVNVMVIDKIAQPSN